MSPELTEAAAQAGLHIDTPAPAAGGYRHADSGPLVELRWRWWTFAGAVPSVLLLTGLVLMTLAVTYFFRIQTQSWGTTIVLGVLLGLPTLAFGYSVVQRACNTTRVQVLPTRIHVSWGPVGASERSLDVAPIVRLIEQRSTRDLQLWAQLDDGKTQRVLGQLRPAIVDYITTLFNEHYELPLHGEGSRATWLGKRRRTTGLMSLIGSVMIASSAWSLGYDHNGNVIARATLTDKAPETTLTVDGAHRVVIDIKARVESSTFASSRSFHQLPRDMNLVVKYREGTLRCDLGNVERLLWQGTNRGLSSASWSWVARLKGCVLVTRPGATPVSLRVETHPGSKLMFKQLDVTLRTIK